MMQTVHYLSIGAVGGAVLGWLTLFIVYEQYREATDENFASEIWTRPIPKGYWRWGVYGALIGALIGVAIVAFKFCVGLPGHPLIC